MIFHIDSAMKHSYSNDDTCFSIDVIDEILEEDFDALLDKGSKIRHSIDGTILEEKFFVEFNEFMAMTADENSEFESDTKEPPIKKITFNTDYKIKTSIKEPPTNLELKPLPNNLDFRNTSKRLTRAEVERGKAVKRKRVSKNEGRHTIYRKSGMSIKRGVVSEADVVKS
nr:reverse transcriptase domain-containing protein [Tanacetum cinerariifolium]